MDLLGDSRRQDHCGSTAGLRTTLAKRLDQREIGSGRDEQMLRSLRQLERMSGEPPGTFVVVPTDDKSPAELAQIVLQTVGWSQSEQDRSNR